MREKSYMYNDKVQEEIHAFLGKSIKQDYLLGSREINLDLKVSEAGKLYQANDTVRAKAESGELQALHDRCHAQAKAVETGYIKVMDELDRVLQSVTEAEQDIYEELLDSDFEGLQRLNSGEHVARVYDILFKSGSMYVAVKEAMNLLGKPGGHMRAPMLPFTEAQRAEVAGILRETGLLPATAAA